MGHRLRKEDGLFLCEVCGWRWKSKPRSRCPGLPRYGWAGAEAAGLATATALAREGLKPGPGQKPAGVILAGDNRNYWRLYGRSEAVAKREMSPAQRSAALANLEKARAALTCVDCRQRFAYKYELDANGRCEACAHVAMVAAARREAEASLQALAAADDWLLVDFETTGRGERAEIVQIGVVDAGGTVLVDRLVRPAGRISWQARRVHGIEEQDVADAPAFPEVYKGLARLLGGRRLLAYNAPFDERMLAQTCARYGLPEIDGDWQCVMRLFAGYAAQWSSYWQNFHYLSLVEACAAMGVRRGPEALHSGSGDALLTWKLVQKFRMG